MPTVDSVKIEHDDRYCYSNSRVLINKEGIENGDKLSKLERKLTTKREMIMRHNPVVGNFDLIHFQHIHYVLFEQLYDWAGKLRECNIYKGGSKFCASVLLEETAPSVFDPIKEHGFFIGDSKEELFEHFAETMGRINMLHPFREGNGRAERMFMFDLGCCCGVHLDFEKTKKDKIIEASLQSEYKDYSGFVEIFEKISTPLEYETQEWFLKSISPDNIYCIYKDLDNKGLLPDRVDEFKKPVKKHLKDFVSKAEIMKIKENKENNKDVFIR